MIVKRVLRFVIGTFDAVQNVVLVSLTIEKSRTVQ